MSAEIFKSNQATLKEQYRANPESAIQKLSASCIVDPGNLAAKITEPSFLSPAGLHPASGGDGNFACSVELMMSGLCSCAAVTLAAVANSMKVELRHARVIATATVDFRGTLAVDREAPVGITGIELNFEIDSPAEPEKIEKLIQLSERYCVVYQTLIAPPEVSVIHSHPEN